MNADHLFYLASGLAFGVLFGQAVHQHHYWTAGFAAVILALLLASVIQTDWIRRGK